MIELPADLEAELATHEERRDDIVGARWTLERAVTVQLRMVADGLLTDLLLRGETVSGPAWWHRFVSRQYDPPQYAPDLKLPAFREYRQGVAQRIATGSVRRIGPGELDDVSIRIYGSRCRLVEEGRINRQFAQLGSSLRLLVIGSYLSRADIPTGTIEQQERSGDINGAPA